MLETDGLKGNNLGAALADIQRLVYITRACLRLIKTYVTQIYPNGGTDSRLCHFQTSKSLKLYHNSAIAKTEVNFTDLMVEYQYSPPLT